MGSALFSTFFGEGADSFKLNQPKEGADSFSPVEIRCESKNMGLGVIRYGTCGEVPGFLISVSRDPMSDAMIVGGRVWVLDGGYIPLKSLYLFTALRASDI